MTLEVRGKEFKIDFVSNYVHMKYGELVDRVQSLPLLQEDAKEINTKYRTGQMERSEFRVKLEEFNAKKNKFAKEVIDLRLEIVEQLVTSNKYDFDESWWLKRTNADDVNKFMIACMTKDSDGKSSKKK